MTTATLGEIKAKLLANKAKAPTSYAPADCYEHDEEIGYDCYTHGASWSVDGVTQHEEIYPLAISPFDVRIGNPDRYDKHFWSHPVLAEIRSFLEFNETPHEIFYHREMESSHKLIVRLTNQLDHLMFYMRFSELTAFKE